jgi:cytidyltransferase-like protein
MTKRPIGFTCSCFDLLHAGHAIMLREAREQCDHLIVGLQTDPTIDRADKNKPIQSLQERLEQLEAIKYVDQIRQYETEKDLYELILDCNPDVRFIGEDWKGKKFTGHDLSIPVVYTRRYGHSTSELRERVFKAHRQAKSEGQNSGRKYVPKGWGYEDWLVNKEEYCGKLLFLKKGKRFSWHYHKLKDETFYVHSGKIELSYGLGDNPYTPSTQKIILEAGDTFHISVGLRHQAKALLDSHVFEFSTTHFDDDSHRIIKGD